MRTKIEAVRTVVEGMLTTSFEGGWVGCGGLGYGRGMRMRYENGERVEDGEEGKI